MSRFFSSKYDALTPYTPGEQPQDMKYVKLNTNESPFPPSPLAVKLAGEAAKKLNLYSDPECRGLVDAACEFYGITGDRIIFSNGSDEVLNFAFMAFCDAAHPAFFADITYGFYSVFAQLNNIPYREIPLMDDFSINVNDYLGVGGTIFIANPNAPTAIALPLSDIERILKANPDNVVVIDEAYVDFGGESAVKLIDKYNNLLVIQTFSKSRSMAGARLGFGIGCPELISDLNTIKYSTNPYNINSMTMAAGIGAFKDVEYFEGNCKAVIATREWTKLQLAALGFTFTDSKANFLFAKSSTIGGLELYQKLKAKGVLVRHFEKPRLCDYNRISIGSMEQMEILIAKIKEITEEKK